MRTLAIPFFLCAHIQVALVAVAAFATLRTWPSSASDHVPYVVSAFLPEYVPLAIMTGCRTLCAAAFVFVAAGPGAPLGRLA